MLLRTMPRFAALSRVCRLSRQLAAERRGAVAVEFAFLLPVLLMMLAGLVDMSRLMSQQMQVQSAAQAGAAYTLAKGWNQAAVAQAIVDATSLPVAAEPAPRTLSACVSGTDIVETTAALCPSGEAPGKYALASARVPFRPLIPWPGVLVPQAIEGSALVRTR